MWNSSEQICLDWRSVLLQPGPCYSMLLGVVPEPSGQFLVGSPRDHTGSWAQNVLALSTINCAEVLDSQSKIIHMFHAAHPP